MAAVVLTVRVRCARLGVALALAASIAACATHVGRRNGTGAPRGGARAADSPAQGGDAPVQAAHPVPSAAAASPPLAPADDGSLVAKIDRATPPRRAAALRLTEQARARLARGEVARAVELLERAVAVDARVPYAYYFLAAAHDQARHPALARSFIARAEQLFASDPYWLGRVHALRGRIAEDAGLLDEARREYERALAVWPGNDDAASGLARLDAPGQGTR